MSGFMQMQGLKAKEIQEAAGQTLIDLVNESKARVKTKRTLRGLTPEELGENLAYQARKTPSGVEFKPGIEKIASEYKNKLPNFEQIKENPAELRKAIEHLHTVEAHHRAKQNLPPSNEADRDWQLGQAPLIANYYKHLRTKGTPNEVPLYPESVGNLKKEKDIHNAIEAFDSGDYGKSPHTYLTGRYGNAFEAGKNKSLLHHISEMNTVPKNYPTKYNELKKSLGYDLSKPIPPQERQMLESKDMDKALALYNSATTPEQKEKALNEYNDARSAQALAFMDPREQAIVAKQPLQAHYPIEEEIQVNPREYQGQWFADQPADLIQGNKSQAEAAKALVDDTKLWRNESNKLYRELNGKAPLSGIANKHLDTLKEDVSPRVNQLMNKHARSLIDSPTYNRFVDQADRKMDVVRRKAKEALEEQIQAMRGHYSASGTHSGGIAKQERLMRENAAQRLEDTYRDMLDSAQGRGIEAAQRERGHQAHLADIYRSSRGQENQGQLNVAQQKAANETQEQQLKHYNLAHKQRAGLAHNTAQADQAVALQNIGIRNQTNDQNRLNASKNKFLHSTGDMDKHRTELIQAAHGTPMAPSFQASATTPAMPAPVSHASQAGTLFAAASTGIANMLQAQQQQNKPQINYNFASGGHVQGRPSSDDLLKAYHGQLEAYEKAARRYQQQSEDYLPTGLRQAGDAFLGVAKGASQGNPIGGFVEGMEKGQKHHDQYMNRRSQRELTGMKLEGNITKGKGSAWKDLAGHENELKKMSADELYKNAHLGIERERLGIERQKIDASNKRANQSAMLRQKGMKPVFDEEGNVTGMEPIPRVLTGQQMARKNEALANMSNALNGIGTLAATAGMTDHIPGGPKAEFMHPRIAGFLGAGEGGVAKSQMFNTASTNVINFAKNIVGAKNIPELRALIEGKVKLGNEPVTNKASAHSGAIGLSSAVNKSISALRDAGLTDEEIQNELHLAIDNAERIKNGDLESFEEVAKWKDATKKDAYGHADHVWQSALQGIKGFNKKEEREERELSNFNPPESAEEQAQPQQAPQPIAQEAPQSSDSGSSFSDYIPDSVKTAYDLGNSALANTAIGVGKGATSLVDALTYPIRKPLSMATGEPIRGLGERFIEPIEKAYEEWEEPKDRGTGAKAALQGSKYAGEFLSSAGMGGAAIKGALKYGPEAARGLKGFGTALKEGNLSAMTQGVGRLLGGESAMGAFAGNTKAVKELAQMTATAAGVGAASKGIQEGTNLPQWGSDLLAMGAVLPGQMAVKGATNLFKKGRLPKDREVTEGLLGEYLFPSEASFKRHEAHFDNYQEPYHGHTSTVAEAAEGLNSNIGSVSKKVSAHNDTAKNRQAESGLKIQEAIEDIKPSKEFMSENKFHEGDLLEQASQTKRPSHATFAQDTASSLRGSFKEKISNLWQERKAVTAPLYEKIAKFKGEVPLSKATKTVADFETAGLGPDMSADVKWFADKVKYNEVSKLDSSVRSAVVSQGKGPSLSASKANEISKELRNRMDVAIDHEDWQRFRTLNNLKSSIDDDLISVVPIAKKARDTYREMSTALNNITKDKSLKSISSKKDGYYTTSEQATVDHFLKGKDATERSRKLIENFGYDSKAAQSLRDHSRNDLFESVVKDGRISQDALTKWTKDNTGAFTLDKNLAKDVQHLNSIKSYQALMESTKALTPHKFLNFMEKNRSNLKNVLSKESISELDELSGLMKKLQHAQAKVLPGESATSVFEDISKRIFQKKENHYWKASKELASNLPVIGRGVKFLKSISKLVNPDQSSFSPQRGEWVAEILDNPKAFKEFMGRHQGRQTEKSIKGPSKPAILGVNRLINDTRGN